MEWKENRGVSAPGRGVPLLLANECRCVGQASSSRDVKRGKGERAGARGPFSETSGGRLAQTSQRAFLSFACARDSGNGR